MTAFVIIEGDVYQLDNEGNPISPNAGASAAVLPATQGGVLISGKRASDSKPGLVSVDDSGRQKIQADALPLPSGAATEATAATLATQATLASIKDTDGVKKITDQLPAGTNEIGLVAQGTKGSGANAWPTAIYDAAGNAIASILSNSIRRIEAATKIFGQKLGVGSEFAVTTIGDTNEAAQVRLQTETRIAPGSTVNIGTNIPSNPADLVIEFLKNGTENMLVNGSGTPVVFFYQPTGSDVVAVEEVRLIFTAADFDFDGASFGSLAKLTNGILVETLISSVVTPIFTIKQNEDFPRVPGTIPLINNTGPKDILVAIFKFGGLLKLDGSTGDRVRITIRDNLTSVQLTYLTATLFGAKE